LGGLQGLGCLLNAGRHVSLLAAGLVLLAYGVLTFVVLLRRQAAVEFGRRPPLLDPATAPTAVPQMTTPPVSPTPGDRPSLVAGVLGIAFAVGLLGLVGWGLWRQSPEGTPAV